MKCTCSSQGTKRLFFEKPFQLFLLNEMYKTSIKYQTNIRQKCKFYEEKTAGNWCCKISTVHPSANFIACIAIYLRLQNYALHVFYTGNKIYSTISIKQKIFTCVLYCIADINWPYYSYYQVAKI